MSDSEYQSSSISICQNLNALEMISRAGTVHAFWPVLQRREPDIRSWLLDLVNRDIRIVLPVVTAFTRQRSNRPRLRHVQLRTVDQLRENRWGIAEPKNGDDIGTDEIDVVIAPALGVDSKGNRLGHGYGYYDEFMADLKIPIICPIFGSCVVDALPDFENDIAVSLIVTEAEIIDLTRT